jgi:hypothetical protein
MKFYTPDNSMLIEVQAVKDHPDGILIEGKIMGAMPMKAILRPEEARAALKLLSGRVIVRVLGMLWRGRKPTPRGGAKR